MSEIVDIYPIDPCPAPRQSRRDTWKPTTRVLRYRAFKDLVRLYKVQLPLSGYHVTFHIPMPKSWSAKKKAAMNGQPHQQKPDKDNLEKALLDALHKDDCMVWDGRVTKRWAETGSIEVRLMK